VHPSRETVLRRHAAAHSARAEIVKPVVSNVAAFRATRDPQSQAASCAGGHKTASLTGPGEPDTFELGGTRAVLSCGRLSSSVAFEVLERVGPTLRFPLV
jgi:hypothetical protein